MNYKGVSLVSLFLVSIAADASAADKPILLVLNKEEATLAFVDPSNGKVLGRVGTGESPHEIAVSSGNKLAFVSNYGSKTPGSTISVIDIAARRELRRVDLSPMSKPHGLFFADGKVYFTAEVNKLIGRYDPGSNRVDWLLGTGQNSTHMVMVNKDATQILTANIGSDSITVIDRSPGSTAWNETVIPVGKGPEGMDISPDGKQLWTAHSRDGGVSVIDLAAKKVTDTFNVGTQRSNRIKFTPDGKLVLVSDLGAGELLVLEAATRKEIKRIKLGRNVEGILMQPDGSRAYVAVAGDNFIAVIDLKTLDVAGRIASGLGPDGMAWVQ